MTEETGHLPGLLSLSSSKHPGLPTIHRTSMSQIFWQRVVKVLARTVLSLHCTVAPGHQVSWFGMISYFCRCFDDLWCLSLPVFLLCSQRWATHLTMVVVTRSSQLPFFPWDPHSTLANIWMWPLGRIGSHNWLRGPLLGQCKAFHKGSTRTPTELCSSRSSRHETWQQKFRKSPRMTAKIRV